MKILKPSVGLRWKIIINIQCKFSKKKKNLHQTIRQFGMNKRWCLSLLVFSVWNENQSQNFCSIFTAAWIPTVRCCCNERPSTMAAPAHGEKSAFSLNAPISSFIQPLESNYCARNTSLNISELSVAHCFAPSVEGFFAFSLVDGCIFGL